jgi:hypothetical protein
MAVVTLVGSRIMDGLDNTPPDMADAGQAGGKMRQWIDTVEVGAADTAASTYLMARLPSNARIDPSSTLYWDDLTTTGSPTVDIGVYNQSGKSDITDDADALSNGHNVTSAGNGLVTGSATSIANYGLPLWDYVSGVSSDPNVDLDIKVALVDANVVGGGTMTMVLNYTVD